MKYLFSILGYIFIIYPLKRFIIPFSKYILESGYFLSSLFLGYMLFYVFDFNSDKLSGALQERFLRDIWIFKWMITPLITIMGIEISPLTILNLIIIFFIIIKIIEIIKLVFDKVKQTFGDVLLVLLWCYYTLAGETENSVLLITKDEAKTKIYMYFIILLTIIVCIINDIFGFYLGGI